jgi:hypothetical protein
MIAKTQEEGLALLDSLAAEASYGKFAAKLSFAQRCEILALHRKGCTRELLAKLYRVDRRTITHIYNQQSPHYKNVREEELRLGRDNFILQYLTLDVQNAAIALMEKNGDKEVNNKLANRKAGIHMMRNDYCDYDHRVMIGWIEPSDQDDIQIAGWYYKDLDSEWPDTWFTAGGPDSLKTSQAAYTAAINDISDKIP